MRGHDQTSRRVRRPSRAGSGLMLVSVLAALWALASASAHGQDAFEAEAQTPRIGASINLTAEEIRAWDDAGVRWIYLAGRVAILQGIDGLRAEQAVARVTSRKTPGGTVHRLDVYAEGITPGPDDLWRGQAGHKSYESQEVQVRPYKADGLARLDAPPRGLAILDRSGLATSTRRAPAQAGRASDGNPRIGAGLPPKPSVAARAEIAPIVVLPVAANPNPPVPAAASASAQPLVARPTLDLAPSPSPAPAPAPAPAKLDPEVRQTQFTPPSELPEEPEVPSRNELPPAIETAPRGRALEEPGAGAGGAAPPTTLEALPGANGRAAAPSTTPPPAPQPLQPGSARLTRVYPRDGNPNFQIQWLPTANGIQTGVVTGGVNIVTESPQVGIVDISSDNAIIWRRVGEDGKALPRGPNGEPLEDARQPLEFYLEGNVIIRQDERKVAGNGDQKTYRFKQAYFDITTERFIGLEGEVDMFAPGLISPMRMFSPRVEQYRPIEMGEDGVGRLGLAELHAENTMGTGSRFPTPGYRFTSRSMDMFRVYTNETDPNSGKQVGNRSDPDAPGDLTWRIDARQNIFWMGRVPVFYWPRFVAEADDLEPPLRQFTFRTNNYFGQQLLTDWNGFRLLGIRKPLNIDMWNVDLDYLSSRTKNFPALGSEIGWFGPDLINDISDPYRKAKGLQPSWLSDYFGYFDIWGLKDAGRDTLGSGPAIITNNRAAGNVGYQRGGGGNLGAVPPFQDYRGRLLFRHMQRLLPDDEAHEYEDFRVQLEAGYTSDRYFLEEYYKRLFDVGMDQETLMYTIRSKDNWAWSIWAEANLQSWYTDTQWLPRLDYYRLGDSLFSGAFSDASPEVGNNQIFRGFTYFQHTGADYANTHTAVEVNNPYIFAFMPYDPISNTSAPLTAFRGYTNHELDMPLNFGNIFRLVPYLQGQAVGWSNQIDGNSLGRLWGAVGARAEIMAWKAYPWVNSELMNVHGLNHKINFEADFRSAYSNQKLDSIGIQDDLDDNTYESVRRYFALTNYAGGLLPIQYDPRHLMLRQMISPITGPTDIQASITGLHLGLHQRLQTKRGPEAKRRIIDYMTFDLDTTYFPDAQRDNFGKPFGRNMYNWQWFIGDRTSIISYGWFEFWNITGDPIYKTNIYRHNDPFGLNVITSGLSISRPPRGNIFIGYTVIDTGPINTSALNLASSYWLSPKWYGTFSTMYDFGNGILLSSMFSLTRIGPDYLTSVGLTVDPQRQSYMFAIQISPRLSPNMRFGSGIGLNNFDSRFAPTQ